MSTGGSIESVVMAGRRFSVAADADTQRRLGGFQNEVQMNGDGTGRLIRTRIPAAITGLVLSVDDTRGDDEFLTQLKNSRDYFDTSVTYTSGETYAGRMQIVNEYQYNSQAGTASVDLNGPGALQRL